MLFDEGAVGLLSDAQLLDRFVERREGSAFEAIVERYGPLVWGVCGRVLRDHHDAEDAFQATFLVLARKAASVMPREKLGNWLYGVAFQTAMKARATMAKRRLRERPACGMTEPEAVPEDRPEELLSRLDREVTRLPDKYRKPIVLCELQGKTHRQAAELLGWPVGTVSGRLSRARALLASRLSRPGTPLTVGALGVLLAHDVAWAGVPPELVSSTARAACLSVAGKAAMAGVFPAEVAALTGAVLKAMLINKLMRIMALLLVTLALAAGGTSLTYRAHATGPANQKDSTNSKEASKEDVRRPKDLERVPRAEATRSSLLVEDWQYSRQSTLQYGGYSFTALRTGDAALAYKTATREVKAVRLNATKEQPLWVTPVVIESSDGELMALGVKGERITRVAAFNFKLGKWTPLDLDPPVNGVAWPRPFGPDTTAYEVGGFLYLFNPKADAWDRLDLRTIADDKQELRATEGR